MQHKSFTPNQDSVNRSHTSTIDAKTVGQEMMMRRFIRHPSAIPIDFDIVEQEHSAHSPLINVSRGGLCFSSNKALPIGATLHIEIQIEQPPFEVEGAIAWCRPDGERFTVGVAFNDRSTAYSVRMVEQVCYIEHYRRWARSSEGRELSSEQAAMEWVSKYAADFPAH